MNQRDLIYEQKRPTIRAKETYYTSGSFFFSEAIVPTAALQAFAQQLSAGAATRLGRRTACAEPSKSLKRPTICGIMIACRKSTRKGKRKGTQNGNGKRKKRTQLTCRKLTLLFVGRASSSRQQCSQRVHSHVSGLRFVCLLLVEILFSSIFQQLLAYKRLTR